MGKARGRIVVGINSLALLVGRLRGLKTRLLVLLVLSLLTLVLLLVWTVSEIASGWAISARTLDWSCSIIGRDLTAWIWEDRLRESRRGRWEDTLVGRRIIAFTVVSSTSKVQVQTIVGVHRVGDPLNISC